VVTLCRRNKNPHHLDLTHATGCKHTRLRKKKKLIYFRKLWSRVRSMVRATSAANKSEVKCVWRKEELWQVEHEADMPRVKIPNGTISWKRPDPKQGCGATGSSSIVTHDKATKTFVKSSSCGKACVRTYWAYRLDVTSSRTKGGGGRRSERVRRPAVPRKGCLLLPVSQASAVKRT
jgi:hypothetical protein